jgi:hypothetical protein
MKKPQYGKVFIPAGSIVDTSKPEWRWLAGVVPPADVPVTALNNETAEWLKNVRKPKGEKP